MAEEVVVEAGVSDGASINTDIGANHEEAQLGNIEDGNLDGLQPEQVKERLLEESRRFLEPEQAVSEQHADGQEEVITPEGQPEGDSEPTREPTIAELQAQLEAQAKRLEDQEKFIGRQSKEVGELRDKEKELADLKTQMESDEFTMDKFLDNPREALRNEVEHNQRVERIRELEQNIELDRRVSENRETVSQFAPEFENQRDSIAKLLESDGIPTNSIQEYMSNIYMQDPAVAVQLSHRARLEAENASLRARLKDPATILQKVDQAASRGPSVTARSGQSAPAQRQISMDDVDHMSEDEVKQALEQIRRSR